MTSAGMAGPVIAAQDVMDAAARRYAESAEHRQNLERMLQQARTEELLQLGIMRGTVESILRLRGDDPEYWNWRLADNKLELTKVAKDVAAGDL